MKSYAYKEQTFSQFGTSKNPGMEVEMGKMLAEALNAKGQSAVLKERFGIVFKEDVNTTVAAGAYTTMLSTTLYEAAIQNIQDILGLVVMNDDLKSKGGFGAYKIPRLVPTTAVEVAEGAVITYFEEGVDSITVTPRKVVAGTALTWEIMKRGMNDFVKFVLQNAADAVTRKLASDIVNGLASGADLTQTGGVTYDNIILARVQVEAAVYSNAVPYGFIADKIVLSTTSYGVIQRSTDWKNTVYYANVRPGDEVVINRPSLMFGNQQIVVTPFLTGALGLVMDSKKCAMLVRESDMETFEGAIPGRPYDREIVALMSYVLAVLYPKACCKLTA